MSGRGGHRGRRGRFGSGRGSGGWKSFSNSNNRKKRHELKFYPHENGPNQQTETFTKVKEHILLKIQNEFVNGIDIGNQSTRDWFYI